MWAKEDAIQHSDLWNGCYLVRFKCHDDYEQALWGRTNPVYVLRITQHIVKPIQVDKATRDGARGKYARMYVEVDLSKRLLPKYEMEAIPYLTVYDEFHNIYIECGLYVVPTHLRKCQQPLEAEPMVLEAGETPAIYDTSNGRPFAP
ncbi:hypothetical protein LINGRAPRIM_LOCUS2486 [Linum grandiflorum]